eukprot:TRINITY_DN41328_c0_g1_i1.p1 TRINITY_DN41328_c0_g1~~TRINITY_DN41328_c0_g1_i1.p1  ORF type:complete len:767 (+),score=98.39 TRINITY_DN41328_c0_g1_i1:161-2461(+)
MTWWKYESWSKDTWKKTSSSWNAQSWNDAGWFDNDGDSSTATYSSFVKDSWKETSSSWSAQSWKDSARFNIDGNSTTVTYSSGEKDSWNETSSSWSAQSWKYSDWFDNDRNSSPATYSSSVRSEWKTWSSNTPSTQSSSIEIASNQSRTGKSQSEHWDPVDSGIEDDSYVPEPAALLTLEDYKHRGRGHGGRSGGLGRFEERGLRRVLVANAGWDLIEAATTGLAGQTLSANKAASATIVRSAEVFSRRGFLAPCTSELLRVPRDLSWAGTGKWRLEWIDVDSNGKPFSSTFVVCTTAGPWRVVVSSMELLGAFPLVVSGHSQGNKLPRSQGQVSYEDSVRCGTCSSCRAAPKQHDKHEWTSQQWKEECSRLEEWSSLLKHAAACLQQMLNNDCAHAYRADATNAFRRLRELCVDDMNLKCELDAVDYSGMSWESWGRKLAEVIGKALRTQERVVLVQDVRFTHNAISTTFLHGDECGTELEALVEDLRAGRVDPLTHESLVLTVVQYRGQLHSINNRRLWALQQYQLLPALLDQEVWVRVHILPWSETHTIRKFWRAYDSETQGQGVKCRTPQEGAPPIGVVASTMRTAVLATHLSSKVTMRQEREVVRRRATSDNLADEALDTSQPVEASHTEADDASSSIWFGNESFPHLKAAKAKAQALLIKRSNGVPVPDDEFHFMLDIFKRHPHAARKRVDEAVKITVGTSEKFPDTPSFWTIGRYTAISRFIRYKEFRKNGPPTKFSWLAKCYLLAMFIGARPCPDPRS